MPGFHLAATGTLRECVDAFLDAAARAQAADRLAPVVALVGSHVLREQLRRRLHETAGGFLGVHLLTFRDLAVRLGQPALAASGRREASALYQRGLVARLLRETAGYFRAVADYDGAAAAMLATFADLEEAGWSAWPAGAPRSPKFASVGGVFDAYRRELSARAFTAADLLAAAAAPDFLHLWGAAELHVVGIYDVNARQRALLDRLAAVADIRLYLPAVLTPAPFAASHGAPAAAWWDGRGIDTRVWSCPDEVDEARAIVREAKRLRAAGVAYHEMGVLLRHGETYADLLAEMCRRAGVPFRAAAGHTPWDDPARRALLRLAELIGSDLGRGAVMALLAATELPADDPDAARWRSSQARWEAVSRAARVRRDDDWDRRLADFAPDPQAAQDLRDAAQALAAGLASMTRAATYREAGRAFATLARRFVAASPERDDTLAALEVLSDLDAARLRFDAVTFRLRTAEIILAAKTDPGDVGGIWLVDFAAARGLRFRVAFVPGCVEAAIPAAPRQDPVLLDADRRALMDATGTAGALPLSGERGADELRLFDAACRSAAERLILSFPRTDPGTGRSRLPSHLLLALLGRLDGAAPAVDDLPRHPRVEVLPAGRYAPEAVADALDDDERDLAALRRLRAAGGAAAMVDYLRRARPDSFARLWRRQANRWSRPEPTTHEGRCEDARVCRQLAARFDRKTHWSVSHIESFALCPRRFLYEHVLRLASPDDPETTVSLSNDRRGELVHDVMESAGRDLDAVDGAALDGLIDAAYAAAVADNLTGGGLLDEVERGRVREAVRAMAEFARTQGAGYEILETEREFTGALDLGDGHVVTLRGRLDRRDRAPDGAERIIDYKTGKAKSALSKNPPTNDSLNAGATLQLPLYLLLAGARVETGAAYWFLKNKEGDLAPSAVTFSPDFAATHRDLVRRIAVDIVRAARDGRFVPRPDVAAKPDNGHCGHCTFTTICDGRGRARLTAKLAGKPDETWLQDLGRSDADDDH